VIRTETVEVYTPVYVKLDDKLTKDVDVPPVPLPNCVDSTNLLPTICNEALAELVSALFQSVFSANDQLKAIRAIQPEK